MSENPSIYYDQVFLSLENPRNLPSGVEASTKFISVASVNDSESRLIEGLTILRCKCLDMQNLSCMANRLYLARVGTEEDYKVAKICQGARLDMAYLEVEFYKDLITEKVIKRVTMGCNCLFATKNQREIEQAKSEVIQVRGKGQIFTGNFRN